MLTLFIGLALLIVGIGFYCYQLDERALAVEIENGKYELKPGYSAYVGLALQLFGLIIMLISIWDASRVNPELNRLFIPIALIFLYGLVYGILEKRNHKVWFDETKIVSRNLLKSQSTIKFSELASVNYSLWGWGRNLLVKDLGGKTIKVSSGLSGFRSLVEFLTNKKMLKK